MQVKKEIFQSPRYLPGVGPRRAEILKRMGIFTIKDLLEYYPYRWEDRASFRPIADLKAEEKVTVRGEILGFDEIRKGNNLVIFRLLVRDFSGTLLALWFRKGNPRWDVFSTLKKEIQKGKRIILYGRVERKGELIVEEYELVEEEKNDSLNLGRIVPIYSLKGDLKAKQWRRWVKFVLDNYLKYVVSWLPFQIEGKYHLLGKKEALRQIHFPTSLRMKERAYHRLVFEEFYLFQLAMALEKQAVKSSPKNHRYQIKRHLLTPFREALNFQFTNSQKRVINEIFNDLCSPYPMNRLLQGDVGSGKTVVILAAILLAAENGYQSAFMAPTEILAEQHYLTLKRLLQNFPLKFALLTSKTKKKEREKILQVLKEGELAFLIGTHSLLEEKVTFKKLTLVVIDEQHRFGVLQRAKLREKAKVTIGSTPDVLVVTATPIPRTLALTFYGDLDVSTIRELPPGRKEIVTLHLSDQEAYQRVKKEIFSGGQAYIVYPLVEESDKLELKAAVKEAERLKKEVFPQYRVGLIHGQMKGKEKEEVMKKFRAREYDILIATTVIEVGIDVPNASVIVIEHADRFGLATLHQLRGRVGRGERNSFCILLGEPKTEEAKRRLAVMLATNDGFKIAEEDLKIRGPGEFFGFAQHGELPFKIGDLIDDFSYLKEASLAVQETLKDNFSWQDSRHQLLKEVLLERFGEKLKLAQVG